MGKYVVVSLERTGEDSQSKKAPSNAVTGVALGTKSMLTSVFSAVAGVIVEPAKGAKFGGIKGGAVGFGKGMLGLVYKPVKGTIDLVTQTTKGISNTPKTMYVAMNRMIKKKPRGQLSNSQDAAHEESKEEEETSKLEVDHTVVGESGDELLYISKR